MRCEEVRQELDRAVADSALSQAVDSHLAACPACRVARRVSKQIDQELKSGEYWTPPAGLSQRVGIKASAAILREREQTRNNLSWTDYLKATLLGGLYAAASMLAVQALLRVAPPVRIDAGLASLYAILQTHTMTFAWTSCALSISVAAWLTRRALQ